MTTGDSNNPITFEEQTFKAEMLALISHDLKTPISNILGFSGVLAGETFGPLNQKQKDYLNVIQKCSKHILELIHDLLDLSKLENGKENLVYEPISIQELIDSCISMVSHKADDKKLFIGTSNRYPFGSFVADKKRMYQILINLFSNSIKYTDFGAVLLSVKKINGCITFTVQDTGCGIPIDKQPFLFIPYQRVTSHVEGTGLGLVLVKKFVELHGGWVSLQSTVGVGTTITVAIPDNLGGTG